MTQLRSEDAQADPSSERSRSTTILRAVAGVILWLSGPGALLGMVWENDTVLFASIALGLPALIVWVRASREAESSRESPAARRSGRDGE